MSDQMSQSTFSSPFACGDEAQVASEEGQQAHSSIEGASGTAAAQEWVTGRRKKRRLQNRTGGMCLFREFINIS